MRLHGDFYWKILKDRGDRNPRATRPIPAREQKIARLLLAHSARVPTRLRRAIIRVYTHLDSGQVPTLPARASPAAAAILSGDVKKKKKEKNGLLRLTFAIWDMTHRCVDKSFLV